MNDIQKSDAGSAENFATHAVRKSSDNVQDASDFADGDVAGVGNIVKNSMDIAGNSVKKATEALSGERDGTNGK